MKNMWKTSLLTVAVLAITLPAASAFAATSQENQSVPSKQLSWIEALRDKQASVMNNLRSGAKSMVKQTKNHGVHKEMYISLLAEKYTPAAAAEWTAVFAERKQLTEQLKALKPTEEERAATKAERTEVRNALKEKLQNGELSKEEFKEQLLTLTEEWRSAAEIRKEQWLPLVEERIELRQSFTDAIVSGDAGQISTALTALLAQAKEENAKLVEIIASLQAVKTPADA